MSKMSFRHDNHGDYSSIARIWKYISKNIHVAFMIKLLCIYGHNYDEKAWNTS